MSRETVRPAIKCKLQEELTGTPRRVKNTEGNTTTPRPTAPLPGFAVSQTHDPDARKPSASYANLGSLFQTNRDNLKIRDLRDFFVLSSTDKSDTRQSQLSELATRRLCQRAGSQTRCRHLCLIVTKQMVDQHERLLAKTALQERSFAKPQRQNPLLIQAGWVTSCLVYPNLPKPEERLSAIQIVLHTHSEKEHFCKEKKLLLRQEHRFCLDMLLCGRLITRSCEDIAEQEYHQYQPCEYHKAIPEKRFDTVRDQMREVRWGMKGLR